MPFRRSVLLLLAVALTAVLSSCYPAAPAPPPVARDATDALGLYPGGGKAAELAQFESWLGERVPYALAFVPGTTWAQLEDPNWMVTSWNDYTAAGGQVTYSARMLSAPEDTLAAGALGAYDHHWRTLAERMVALGAEDGLIRPGFEFNGNWFPWKVRTLEAADHFAAYWRRIVYAMRSVPGAAFRFDWNYTWGRPPVAGLIERAYPGDAFVDVISTNIYDQSWEGVAKLDPATGTWTDPAAVWNSMLNADHGLRWMRDFAGQHGKPMGFSEWGLNRRNDGRGGGDNPYFIEAMHEFIRTSDVLFANYMNFDSSREGQYHHLSNFPRARAKFQELFGA